MKTLVYSLFLTAFISCNLVKPQSLDAKSQTAITLDQLVQNFATAVIKNDENLILASMPTVAVARSIVPVQTKDKSDDEIKAEMLTTLSNRFRDNLSKLQDNINDNDVDRAMLSYDSYILNEPTWGADVPQVLEVKIKNGDKIETIPVTILKLKDSWYIFEILHTSRAFVKD